MLDRMLASVVDPDANCQRRCPSPSLAHHLVQAGANKASAQNMSNSNCKTSNLILATNCRGLHGL